MTDRIVPETSVNRPYWDDFDEDKKFLRMLFRPGYSVQARELTQLQTIMQKQIDRFGSHIFKNGSIVLGAETFFDKKVVYLKLLETYADTTVNVNNFLNQNIVNTADSNVTGRVVAVAEKTSNGSEPKTLIVQLTGAAGFTNGATIQVIGSSIYATLQSSEATGTSSIAKINEGVFFLNGYFVKNTEGVVILDKYGSNPSYKVGLQIDDSIVTETTDTSLLDPALESSNYLAPGAARYKIDLVLSKRALDSIDDSKFIELLRIEDGVIVSQIIYPQYSELEKTLARRTYDESGDYTVRSFKVDIKSHIGDFITGSVSASNNSTALEGNNTIFLQQITSGDIIKFGSQSLNVSTITDNTHITLLSETTEPIPAGSAVRVVKEPVYTIKIEPGKAYIKGYEFETISPVYLSANKARDFATSNNYSTTLNYGNYFFATNANGFFNVVTTPLIVDLHNAASSSVSTGGSYDDTKIGTARIIATDYTSGQGNNSIYRVHLFDIRFTSNASFANVKSISTNSSKQGTMDVDSSSKDSGGLSFLTDTTFGSMIFRLPQSAIKADSIEGQSYITKSVFTNQSLSHSSGTATSGTLTLGTGQNYRGSGTLDSFTTRRDFIVVVRDRQTSNLTTGQILDYANNNLRVSVTGTTTATVSCTANAAFAADIIATVTQATSSPKVKTLVTANTSVIANVANYGGLNVSTTQTRVFANIGQVQFASGRIANSNVWHSLYLSDVTSIRVIQNANSTSDFSDSSKDVTSRFQFDNGQRDTFYDHARIKLNVGATAPTGNVIVLANYYTHSGSGYATVDSYPNASNTGYEIIPVFTSPTTGQVYQLRDSIDFRPRRIDANGTTTVSDVTDSPDFTIENAKFFDPETTFDINSFSYYLARIDKLIVTKDRQFKMIRGIPSLRPVPPPDDPNGMTLYIITLPAYTFGIQSIKARFIENKRYTMRDIGALEKRIQNLEYYNVLNLLEKKATDMVITDDDGLPRSKYGVLVDSFTGFQIADVHSQDLRISMDTQKGELRPYIITNSLAFTRSAESSIKRNGSIITLPYTTETLASQPSATTYSPVAAYSFANWLGSISLSPESDYWYDYEQAPAVVANLNGTNDNWVALGQLLQTLGANAPQNPFGTVWNSWQTIWSGVNVLDSSTYTQTTSKGYITTGIPEAGENWVYQQGNWTIDTTQTIQRTTTDALQRQVRTGVSTVIVPETITESLGNKLIDVSIIPFIRAQDITFVGRNFRPNRSVLQFFDGVDITAYCERPEKLVLNNVVSFIDTSENPEIITNQNGNTAYAVMSDSDWLYIKPISGTFAANDVITGANSGNVANVSVYYHRSANAVSANSGNIKLSTLATTSNTAYINNYIYITTGPGAGQRRKMVSYNTTTQIVTVDRAWDTTPTANSRYSLGIPITTPSGSIVGIFHLPSTSNTVQFRTGERVFRIIDTVSGEVSTCTTSGDAKFYAQGLLETRQEDLISIRVPKIVREELTQERTLHNITTQDQVISSQTSANVSVTAQQLGTTNSYLASIFGVDTVNVYNDQPTPSFESWMAGIGA